MKIFITLLTIVLLPVFSFCQQQPAQIIFNVGYLTITNHANLVVQNPQPAALTVLIKQQVINNQTTEISVSNLAAGSYIIRINDENNISTFKIIKR